MPAGSLDEPEAAAVPSVGPAGSLDEPGPAGSLDEPGPSVGPAGSLDEPESAEPGPSAVPGPSVGLASARTPRAAQGESPLYKGDPLDAERGPGLGCFWVQIVMLGVLLVLTPLTVVWAWDERISAVLLLITLGLLLFAGQTVIFLLRLVAADRRSRRVPRSASARRTVGMLEDEGAPVPSQTAPPATDDTSAEGPRPA
ncbi:MAG: hypothetical protein U0667_14595 [Chloroflexota bacterium]